MKVIEKSNMIADHIYVLSSTWDSEDSWESHSLCLGLNPNTNDSMIINDLYVAEKYSQAFEEEWYLNFGSDHIIVQEKGHKDNFPEYFL